MSNNIDQRILSIQFDNANFEANIQKTLKSLDSLTKGLDISTAVDGLQNALGRVNANNELGNIAAGVDEVADRFSTLGIVGMTVLQNLTNTAVDFGKTLVTKILDPLVEGGKRRALNIEQAKFQFEGLGMDVEKAMNSAREAVTGTAYGLDSAAKAASQFGASGMQAGDEMTSALRAIAGVAAMTSSEYDDIARIFTTVAGNGRVMANELNQIASRGINAAAALGKYLGKSEEEVRKMVSKGQIDFKTFSDAMDDAFGEHAKSANETFTGAMANVRAALSRIGADVATPYFEHMRDVLNALIPVIDGVHDALKPLIDVISNLMETGKNIAVNLLNNVDLSGFSSLVTMLTEAFKMEDETLQKLQRTWAGVTAIVDIAVMALKAVLTAVKDVIVFFVPATSSVLDFSASLGDMLVGLRDAIKETGVFNAVFDTLGKIVEPVGKAISYAFESIMNALAGISKIDLSPISDFFSTLAVRLNPFKSFGDASSNLGTILTGLVDIFKQLGTEVGKAVDFVTTKLGELMEALNFDNVLDMINSLLLTGGLMGFKAFFDSLETSVRTAGGIFIRLDAVLKPLRITLEAYQQTIKAGVLLKIATAIALLAASLLVLSSIDSKKLLVALGGMAAIMAELTAVMFAVTAMTLPKGLFGITKLAAAFIGIAIAVSILATALKKISDLDTQQIANGLIGIAGLSAILVGAAVGMSTVSGPIMKTSAALILFAAAVNILTTAVERMSEIDTNELIKGLIGVGVVLGELVLFLNMTNFGAFNAAKAVGLIGIASAVVILAEAVDKFSRIKATSLIKAIGAMGLVLAELSLFVTFTGGNKMIATAVSLNLIGAAMLIFGEAIGRMGSLQWDEIARGLVAMAGSLSMVTLALNLMTPGVLGKATGLVVVASSLLILGEALRKLSGLQWDEIARGLTALAGSLGVMVVAMNLTKTAIGGAAALLIMATAIAVLAPALQSLGSMSLPQIGIGLLAMAGAFTVLGVAATVLAPMVPAIISLSGAIVLLGVGALAAGAGIALLATALATLAVSGAAGLAALVTVIMEIVGLIPAFATAIGEGLMAILEVIIANMPLIVEAFTAIISGLLNAIVTNIPNITAAAMDLLTAFLQAIAERLPDLITAGMDIVLGILRGIRDNIQEIVEVGVDIVLNLLKGIESRIDDIIQGGFDLAIAFINGVADAIGDDANQEAVVSAVENLIRSILDAALSIVTGLVGGALDIGRDIVRGIAQGIANFAHEAVEAGKQLIRDIFTGSKQEALIRSPSVLFEKEVGRWIPQGIAEGIKKDTSAEEAARMKVQNIVNAFKDEFDKVDLRSTTVNLEHQLWSALNPNASYAETSSREIGLLNTKVAQQQERTKLAMDEYQYMLEEFGADNDDTKNAYNKMLQEQIDLATLSNELTETLKANDENKKTMVENQRSAYSEYVKWYNAQYEMLQKAGLTDEQIAEEAKRATGYNPDAMAKTMSENASSAVSTAMTTVETTYEEQSEATFGGLLNSFTDWGTQYAGGLGDGFLVEFKIVMTNIEKALNDMADRIEIRLDSIIERISNVTSNMSADISPTITPVVDMSNVNSSAASISKTLSGSVVLGVAGAVKAAGRVVSTSSKDGSDRNAGSSKGTTVNFTQVNNSPKALDRLSVYRDTNNAVSKIKGMVKA